ncbi:MULTISPECIES: zinc-ribbon domain-containing protein [Paracoccus]|uniref:zinc-ribbon domain-containing protein n=1 Tax=Paracoccus TaxID=265 RepID=UPI00086CBDBF|nr:MULTISPECIES: zinc-ribbon domain-containing protein [Paracoccus]ODT59726.1 MAG: hypothetical protein ABS73_08650 [Paracoccus sp. SCN 68-21]
MAEFTLICPGCGAEYALPRDAIPPVGREVECSDCGHVWQARPPAPEGRLDLGSFTRPRASDALRFDEDDPRPAPPLPPASKRLSPDVLDILRDEVEHERRLREAEAQPAPGHPSDEIEWPATTVVLPDPGRPAPGPGSPTVIRHPATRPALEPRPAPSPSPVAQPTPKAEPQPASRAATDGNPAPRPVPSAPQRDTASEPQRGGFAFGFGLMLAVAGAVVAVYLLAPALAGREDALSRQLLSWRADLDALRLWLAQMVGR